MAEIDTKTCPYLHEGVWHHRMFCFICLTFQALLTASLNCKENLTLRYNQMLATFSITQWRYRGHIFRCNKRSLSLPKCPQAKLNTPVQSRSKKIHSVKKSQNSSGHTFFFFKLHQHNFIFSDLLWIYPIKILGTTFH